MAALTPVTPTEPKFYASVTAAFGAVAGLFVGTAQGSGLIGLVVGAVLLGAIAFGAGAFGNERLARYGIFGAFLGAGAVLGGIPGGVVGGLMGLFFGWLIFWLSESRYRQRLESCFMSDKSFRKEFLQLLVAFRVYLEEEEEESLRREDEQDQEVTATLARFAVLALEYLKWLQVACTEPGVDGQQGHQAGLAVNAAADCPYALSTLLGIVDEYRLSRGALANAATTEGGASMAALFVVCI